MSKHFDKANRELIKKENRKLQIEQERLKKDASLNEVGSPVVLTVGKFTERDNLILQCKKEAKQQITFHKKEARRWEGMLYKLHKKELKPNIVNDFNFLYFSDKILANDRTKRAGFWLRSQEAINVMNDLEEIYNIAPLFPRKNNKEEPLMFAGLYIHYAKWIGEDAEKIAKLEIWEALREHCIDFETGQLTFGDIATIMGVIY